MINVEIPVPIYPYHWPRPLPLGYKVQRTQVQGTYSIPLVISPIIHHAAVTAVP